MTWLKQGSQEIGDENYDDLDVVVTYDLLSGGTYYHAPADWSVASAITGAWSEVSEIELGDNSYDSQQAAGVTYEEAQATYAPLSGDLGWTKQAALGA